MIILKYGHSNLKSVVPWYISPPEPSDNKAMSDATQRQVSWVIKKICETKYTHTCKLFKSVAYRLHPSWLIAI